MASGKPSLNSISTGILRSRMVSGASPTRMSTNSARPARWRFSSARAALSGSLSCPPPRRLRCPGRPRPNRWWRCRERCRTPRCAGPGAPAPFGTQIHPMAHRRPRKGPRASALSETRATAVAWPWEVGSGTVGERAESAPYPPAGAGSSTRRSPPHLQGAQAALGVGPSEPPFGDRSPTSRGLERVVGDETPSPTRTHSMEDAGKGTTRV